MDFPWFELEDTWEFNIKGPKLWGKKEISLKKFTVYVMSLIFDFSFDFFL